jgi:hypothetical protein
MNLFRRRWNEAYSNSLQFTPTIVFRSCSVVPSRMTFFDDHFAANVGECDIRARCPGGDSYPALANCRATESRFLSCTPCVQRCVPPAKSNERNISTDRKLSKFTGEDTPARVVRPDAKTSVGRILSLRHRTLVIQNCNEVRKRKFMKFQKHPIVFVEFAFLQPSVSRGETDAKHFACHNRSKPSGSCKGVRIGHGIWKYLGAAIFGLGTSDFTSSVGKRIRTR